MNFKDNKIKSINTKLNQLSKFQQLTNKYEKWSLLMTHFFSDKRYIRSAKLKKEEQIIFKKLFLELHVRFSDKIVKGPQYITVSRLIQNFLLSRTKENLRLVLFSYKPYNLTAFVHGIRSQIEVNALLNKFILKDDPYFEEYFLKSENRNNDNKLINIITLIEKLDNKVILYKILYDDLSNLLHPNPSGVKLHSQAGPSDSNIEGLYSPSLSFYFDETVVKTKVAKEFFDKHLIVFIETIVHFFILFDQLDKSFFINEDEKKHFHILTSLELFNQKEFLDYINIYNENEQIDMAHYFEWLDNKKKHKKNV